MQNNELYNYEAEINVLSLLIESGTNTDKQQLLDELLPNDFVDLHNSRIFSAMRELSGQHVSLDTVSVGQHLNDSRVEYGGYGCLQQIAMTSVSLYQVKHYVKIIKELSFKRKVIEHANQLLESSTGGLPNNEIAEKLELGIKLTDSATGRDVPEFSHYAEEWLDDFERRQKLNGAIDGLPTGFPNIDEKINGLKPGWLVVVAGRPSHGKTYFTQTIAEHLAINNKKPVLFFSLEMTGKELFQRSMISQSNLNPESIKKADDNSHAFWGKISQAQQAIINSPMFVDDTAGQNMAQIRAKARRFKKKHEDMGCIMVDYLGLIKKEKADRNDIAIGNIVIGLKSLGKELGVPVILLVQANRASDQVKRPTMSNLKDSSDIEATADLVLFVHRDEIANPETPFKGITEIIWAKDRHNSYNGTEYLTVVNGKLVPVSAEEIARIEHDQQVKEQEEARQYKENNRKGMKF